MNWGLIGWCFGALLTLYAIKFLWLMIRSLMNKDTMESLMQVTGKKIQQANKNMTKNLQRKAKERRRRIQEEQRASEVRVTIQ